jgi:hypothetical protein
MRIIKRTLNIGKREENKKEEVKERNEKAKRE